MSLDKKFIDTLLILSKINMNLGNFEKAKFYVDCLVFIYIFVLHSLLMN